MKKNETKRALNIMNIIYKDLKDLKPYSKNPRQITDKAIEVVKNSIKRFGMKQPMVIDCKKGNEIVCGHTRYKALVLLQLEDEAMMDFTKIPCVDCADLTPSEIRAYRVADNKTGEFSLWDEDLLQVEIEEISDIDLGDFGIDYELGKAEDTKVKGIEFEEKYEINIDCKNEDELEKIYNEMTKRGYKCKILTL